MTSSEKEYTHPKLGYRMPRDKLDALRRYCFDKGVPAGAVLTLLVEALLAGDVKIQAREIAPWEK